MDSPINGGAPSSRASCGRRPDRSGSATLLHRGDLLRPGMEGDWCGRDVLLHMAAWLPIGHVDGERLETLVPLTDGAGRGRSGTLALAPPRASPVRPQWAAHETPKTPKE